MNGSISRLIFDPPYTWPKPWRAIYSHWYVALFIPRLTVRLLAFVFFIIPVAFWNGAKDHAENIRVGRE